MWDTYHPVDDVFYSHMHIYVRLSRQPSIYNMRFSLGSALLTIMAFFKLFIKPDEPDRLGFANTCFLGIVSWQFILVASTPALGYPTRMDVFLVMSLIFITGVYLWNAVHAGYWGTVDEAAAPRKSASSNAVCELPSAADKANGGAAASKPKSLLSRGLEAMDAWGHDGSGYWSSIGIHRKLDLLAFVVFSIGYIIASAAIMAAALSKPGAPSLSRQGE